MKLDLLRLTIKPVFLALVVTASVACGGETSEEGSGGGGGSQPHSMHSTGPHGSPSSSASSMSNECTQGCAELGFGSGEPDGDSCVCDDPNDDACGVGTEAICVCEESAGEPCSDEDAFNIYVNCHQDNDGARDIVTCVGSYVENNQIDCDASLACF